MRLDLLALLVLLGLDQADLLAQLAHPVPSDPQGHKDLRDRLASVVCRDLPDHLAQLGCQDLLEALEIRDSLDHLVTLVHKEIQALRGLVVAAEPRVRLEPRVPLVHQEIWGQLDHLDLLEIQVCLVLLESLGLLDLQVKQDRMEQQEILDLRVLLEILETQDRLV